MSTDKQQLSAFVVRLQQGDGKAFEEIYNLTRESAYFTALKISKNEDDAEDILQEAYVHMLDKIKTLDNPDVFQSWFNQIVANKAKDLLRKSHPERFTNAYFETEEGEEKSKFDFIEDKDEAIIPDAVAENTELCREVMKMIDALSDDKRTAVILYYYDNMTTREIAESLGVNENTVKSRLVQAKKDLAKSVTEYEKKHGKLLGVAPMPLVVWSLKTAAAGAASASASSGAAAATLAAISAGSAAGTAAAGAGAAGAAAGTGIVTKIIAGIVAAAIVGGGAVAGTKAAQNRREKSGAEQTSVSEEMNTGSENSGPNQGGGKKGDDAIYIIPKEDKKVDADVRVEDLKYGVSGIMQSYTHNGKETVDKNPTLDRTKFKATYNELLPAARENRSAYSADINQILTDINSDRAQGNKLQLDEPLTLQANARAEEIAWSGKTSSVRPDGSDYTTIFDANGYTGGTRYEIRAVNYSSPADAAKIWKKTSNRRYLDDPAVTKIGIGVAKDPGTGKYVYVIHLYSPSGSAANEAPGAVNEALESMNEKALEYEGSNVENAERVEVILEELSDVPVIGELVRLDIPVDWLMELLTDSQDSFNDRILELVDLLVNGR